jgi:tRNA (guanine-N7-)-methyltransferase
VSPEARKRKLYGRRKGQKLSAHQDHLLATLLPELALVLEAGRDPRSYFSSVVDDVWLEVGFGAGEHLLWQAEHHPHIGLIGAEPYISGVAKLLSKLAAADGAPATLRSSPLPLRERDAERDFSVCASAGEGLPLTQGDAGFEAESGPPLPQGERGRPSPARTRLRLYSDDARNILDALPDASLGRVFILFPDPWPKTRHHKRRFIQMETLDALARVMKTGAELRFASDDADYVNWTLERVIAHPAFAWTATCAQDWQTRSADWPQTRYEAKELHGKPVFLKFVKSKNQSVSSPASANESSREGRGPR